jgi:hypothetical protein
MTISDSNPFIGETRSARQQLTRRIGQALADLETASAQLDDLMTVAPTSGQEFVAFDPNANDRDVRDLRADLADARRTVRAAVQVDRSITEHNTT